MSALKMGYLLLRPTVVMIDDDKKRPPPPPPPEDESTPEIEQVAGPSVDGPDLRGINDPSSLMYVQTCFWVAHYVRMRASRGDFTEDQLIEQFGVNVRKCIDPEWKPEA